MLRVTIDRPSPRHLDAFRRQYLGEIERAAAKAVDRETMRARDDLRADIRAAGLGRLGSAIGAGSDLRKSRVLRLPNGRFRVSGWLYVRGRSERVEGALRSFTEGASISPKAGQFLWRPTSRIPQRAGRLRMTPELYNAQGFDERIGPLVFVPGRAGRGLLVVKNVTTRTGRNGSARRMPRRGGVREGREAHNQIVAFVGLRTMRHDRKLTVESAMRAAVARLPGAVADYARGR